MKKFLSFFRGRDAAWLYTAVLAMAVCPTMVSALGALIKGSLLGETEVFFTKMIGSFTGWVFLCFAFGAALNEEYNLKKALRLLPRQLLNGVFPIMAVYTALEWLLITHSVQMPVSVYLFMSLIETLLFLPGDLPACPVLKRRSEWFIHKRLGNMFHIAPLAYLPSSGALLFFIQTAGSSFAGLAF